MYVYMCMPCKPCVYIRIYISIYTHLKTGSLVVLPRPPRVAQNVPPVHVRPNSACVVIGLQPHEQRGVAPFDANAELHQELSGGEFSASAAASAAATATTIITVTITPPPILSPIVAGEMHTSPSPLPYNPTGRLQLRQSYRWGEFQERGHRRGVL